jgi:hypothetical protein
MDAVQEWALRPPIVVGLVHPMAVRHCVIGLKDILGIARFQQESRINHRTGMVWMGRARKRTVRMEEEEEEEGVHHCEEARERTPVWFHMRVSSRPKSSLSKENSSSMSVTV